MAEFEEDHSFQCPYCASIISIHVDISGGRKQSFTTDCEICCRPIQIHATVDDDGIPEIEAEREN